MFLKSFNFKQLKLIFIICLSLILYGFFSYGLARHEHVSIGLCVLWLFILYILLLKMDLSISLLIKIGLLFRIIILFSVPNLSQDFYRFFWDGQLLLNGINPYQFTPNQLISSKLITIPEMNEAYEMMGKLSQNNYSNYPPIHQLITFLSCFIKQSSVFIYIIFQRIILILFDLGILYFGLKLSKEIGRSKRALFFYFLNPLVIIELIGNLHFEGVMIFFMTLSFYYLSKKKEVYSGLFLGISILTKLIPFIIMPFFLCRLGFKKSIFFVLITVAVVVLGFTHFLNFEFLINYSESIGLWFSNFEFNASFYYALKKVFEFMDLDLIDYMVYILPCSIFGVTIYLLSQKKIMLKDILTQCLLILTIYTLISTTVHPWYIIPLLFISCLTNYRYPIYWSLTIFLSYWSYFETEVVENYFLITVEYATIIGILSYEYFTRSRNFTTSSTD